MLTRSVSAPLALYSVRNFYRLSSVRGDTRSKLPASNDRLFSSSLCRLTPSKLEGSGRLPMLSTMGVLKFWRPAVRVVLETRNLTLARPSLLHWPWASPPSVVRVRLLPAPGREPGAPPLLEARLLRSRSSATALYAATSVLTPTVP